MMQIFHNIFLLDATGNHPEPFSLVSVEDIEAGKWKFNPGVAAVLGIEPGQGQQHLLHYVKKLRKGGKYELTVWPYHAMLGGIGHALVAAVEEAIFFHAGARSSQPIFQLKGDNPLTEHYSVLRPEVLEGVGGKRVGAIDTMLIDQLLSFDAVLVAGQAKSHCIAWTVEDVLTEIVARDARLVQNVYLLEDCTSPVVVPDLIDYTDKADESFQRFAAAGMHLVRSTEPLASWLES